jgi:SAM-dependent methyltransferase
VSGAEPAPFFAEQLPTLRRAAALGPVLDVACGRGRHALAAAEAGARVLGLDRNLEALRALAAAARLHDLPVLPVQVDLETGDGLPVGPGSCGAVLVFRYLHRPLAQALQAVLRPGGLLLYETFTRDQRDLGHGPRNADFLLDPGELAGLFPRLRTVHYWEGVSAGPPAAALARLAARRPR